MSGDITVEVLEHANAWISTALRNVTKQTTLPLARTALGVVHDGMLNAGQLSGFRNRIINGDMAIDQRNAGAAVTLSSASFGYPVDRFAAYLGSALVGTVTAQRVATSLATDARYAIRLARSAGAYASVIFLAQAVETANSSDLAGKKVILSFKARKGSAFVAGVTASILTGNGADQSLANMVAGAWTGQATAGAVTPSLTTSFATYSVSATLGASVSQIGIYIATGVFSGSGGANDYFDITDVQIEICDATLPQATPFERRPIGIELALCQRYYWKSFPQGTAPAQNAGAAGALIFPALAATTNHRYALRPPVPMRSSPTRTYYNPSAANAQARDIDAGADCSSTVTLGASTASAEGGAIFFTTPGGSAAGNAVAVHATFDAEL